MKFPVNPIKSDTVRLSDGQSITGFFIGDPLIYDAHFVNNTHVECEGDGVCKYCDAGERIKQI